MREIEQTPLTTANNFATERVERLFMENNLLRVMGYLFCHDPRAINQRNSLISSGVVLDNL
jgi:hypothetical protein